MTSNEAEAFKAADQNVAISLLSITKNISVHSYLLRRFTNMKQFRDFSKLQIAIAPNLALYCCHLVASIVRNGKVY